MALTHKKLSLLHVAKSRLGLGDDDYRAILSRVAGVESGRDLSEAGFNDVMTVFQRLGFQSTFAQRNLGNRIGMATPNQVAKIRMLWSEYTGGEGTAAALDKWIHRQFKVSSVRFLTADVARKTIGALIKMNAVRAAKNEHAA